MVQEIRVHTLLPDGMRLGIFFCLDIVLAFSPYGKNVWHNKLKRSKSLLWLRVSQWVVPISFSLWHSSTFWWDCVTEEATQVMHPASKDRRKKWTSFQYPPLGHTSKTSFPKGSTISQYLFSPMTKDFTLGLWGHISDLH